MRKILNAVILLLFVTTCILAQENKKAILAGNLLNVADGTLKKNVLIVIEKDKIVKITDVGEKDKYPNLIDLSEYTVLPGLMDCHAHLTLNYYDKSADIYELPAASYGIFGTTNAKKTLEAGFTTVRDLHSYFYSDVALRDAINRGWIPGPRMYVSGSAITMTGGHGAWANWLTPQLELTPNPGAIADGEDEVRREVRKHIKHGVDVIKIMATGGFGTSGSIPGAASYTVEELKAAVEEARKRGIKVAAHAHGAEGIKNAIKAGVHSIEHASFLDQESIDLMKKDNVYLVMDVLAAHYDLVETKQDFSDKNLKQTNEELYKNFVANLIKAYNQDVKIAFGTDSSVFPHERVGEQFKLMQQAGMKPADIIRSATINAADLIGIEKQAGTIEAGKWADIIAVKGNPLEDVSVLEKVTFVMKGGKVFKHK